MLRVCRAIAVRRALGQTVWRILRTLARVRDRHAGSARIARTKYRIGAFMSIASWMLSIIATTVLILLPVRIIGYGVLS